MRDDQSFKVGPKAVRASLLGATKVRVKLLSEFDKLCLRLPTQMPSDGSRPRNGTNQTSLGFAPPPVEGLPHSGTDVRPLYQSPALTSTRPLRGGCAESHDRTTRPCRTLRPAPRIAPHGDLLAKGPRALQLGGHLPGVFGANAARAQHG